MLETHENMVDFGNYTPIALDKDVVLILKKGLLEAQAMF